MRKTLLFAPLMTIIAACSSMDPVQDWQKDIGGTGKDGLRNIEVLSDGGFILAGWVDQIKPGHVGTGYIAKLDARGRMVWDKNIVTNGENRVSNVLERGDGTLLLIVEEYPIASDPGQVILMVLDSAGSLIGQSELGDAGPDIIEVARPTPDGGFVFGGESATRVEGDYQGWIGRVSSELDIIWEHRLGPDNQSDVIQDVALIPDGSVLGVGMVNKHNLDAKNPARPWIIKIDPAGKLLWSKTAEVEGLFALRGIVPNSMGGATVVGHTRDWKQNEMNSWIGAITSDGEIVWQTEMEKPGYDQLLAVEATSTGQAVGVGTVKSGEGDYDVFVVLASENGRDIRQYVHRKPGVQFGRVIKPLKEDQYAIGGFNSADTGANDQQLWLLVTKLSHPE